MKTILFPTDFSPNALHAARYAGVLANKLNANVVLLNVYPLPYVTEYQQPIMIEQLMLDNRINATKVLREFAEQFAMLTNISPHRIYQRVEYGFIGDSIVETADSIKADMIVMGTRGADNALDRWIGTNAQKVMKSADCPVWIIPEKAEIKEPHTIMYAADFKEDEILAVHKISDLAKPLGAICNVVHIQEYFEVDIDKANLKMVGSLEDEFEYEDDVTIKNLTRADARDALETYIKNHNPDVLAMAIHEKSFLGKIMDASITKHFVQQGKIPMLTFTKK
jgi:nucleotide-binding universal stress UspA family protein